MNNQPVLISQAKISTMELGQPEQVAMLQAMYSRSPMPIAKRLADLGLSALLNPASKRNSATVTYSKSKVGKAAQAHAVLQQKLADNMGKYFIGYGHKSVGDLAEVVIFIENVSLVAAKAVQHSPLYDGQEVSTRYVDFTEAGVVEFAHQDHDDAWVEFAEHALKFQARAQTYVSKFLEIVHKQDQHHPDFAKTIKAATFDVTRGFLPAGILTSLAWKTSFSHAMEHLHRMSNHPLKEVQDLAVSIFLHLESEYPNVFNEKAYERVLIKKSAAAKAHWKTLTYKRAAHLSTTAPAARWVGQVTSGLPQQSRVANIVGKLDYGSWRDLARHRVNMVSWGTPISNTRHEAELKQRNGGGDYYTALLHQTCIRFPEFRAEVAYFLDHAVKVEKTVKNSPYTALLRNHVPIHWMPTQEQFKYVAVLRTSKTVHPTLREFMHGACADLGYHPKGVDRSWSNWTLKRGTQDIVKKS